MVKWAPSACRRAAHGQTGAECVNSKKVLVILPMSACCCLPKMDDCGASFNVTGAERAFYLRVS